MECAHFLIEVLVLFFFFQALLTLENILCILDTSSLSNMWFANIFCQFITYLFILLTGNFMEHKILILIKSNLSIFPFMDHAFGVKSKNSLAVLDTEVFPCAFL